MLTFATIHTESAADILVSPTGETVPFGRRALLFQKLVGMTPVEFSRQYDATPEDVLISHGYLYVNGQTIQVEGTAVGVARGQVELLMAYLKTLPDKPPVELMVLEHNPDTYQLLSENLYFEGSPRMLENKLLGAPDLSVSHSGFDTQVPYTYVPQKGRSPGAERSTKPGAVTNTVLRLEPPKSSSAGLTFASVSMGLSAEAEGLTIEQAERDSRAPESVELLGGYTHYGLPRVSMDGSWEYALATDRMADKAAYAAIMDSVWAFNTDFLMSHMKRGVDEEMVTSVKERYESGNEVLKGWLKSKQEFVSQAIGYDGRGHFLSPYDGQEHTLDQYYLRVQDLPKEVLRALRITRGATEEVYVYEINH